MAITTPSCARARPRQSEVVPNLRWNRKDEHSAGCRMAARCLAVLSVLLAAASIDAAEPLNPVEVLAAMADRKSGCVTVTRATGWINPCSVPRAVRPAHRCLARVTHFLVGRHMCFDELTGPAHATFTAGFLVERRLRSSG